MFEEQARKSGKENVFLQAESVLEAMDDIMSNFSLYGDFDLLMSAAYTGQKIVEYPIYYRSRIYGRTQISRFRDGFKLLKYIVGTFFLFKSSYYSK